jgi:hypothetical protein
LDDRRNRLTGIATLPHLLLARWRLDKQVKDGFVRVDPEAVYQLRVRAAQERTTSKELVGRLILNYCSKPLRVKQPA